MRASYKNTSMALLVTLALSLFFVYAMKPRDAAGLEINQLSSPSIRSASGSAAAGVSIRLIEGVKTENSASAWSPSATTMAPAREEMVGNDFKIALNSAVSTQVNTQVASALTSEDNTQHRVEYYISSVCND